jgi:hypothetical protein
MNDRVEDDWTRLLRPRTDHDRDDTLDLMLDEACRTAARPPVEMILETVGHWTRTARALIARAACFP